PHGQTTQSGDYQATVEQSTLVVESPFLNRLTPHGTVCAGSGGSQEFFNEPAPDGRGEGGSPEEADLAGPYDGRLGLLLAGRGTGQLPPLTHVLETTFPAPGPPAG